MDEAAPEIGFINKHSVSLLSIPHFCDLIERFPVSIACKDSSDMGLGGFKGLMTVISIEFPLLEFHRLLAMLGLLARSCVSKELFLLNISKFLVFQESHKHTRKPGDAHV